LFVAANNPAVTCPDVQAVRRGLARPDLFTVVHDPFVSDTARYADIVLPATTYLETEDFFRAYGAYYMQFAPRVLAPQGEARSNVDLARELARRLNVTDPVFSMTTDQMIALMFEKATGPAATIDPASLRDAGPIKVTPYPNGQTFATPSGKLEFYSSQLEAQGLPPMPDWLPEEDDRPRWPLQLLTAPGYHQSHTAFSGNRTLRKRAGAPICVLHPDDATSRGLRDGDPVDLVNDRGSIGFKLKVSDETLPGTVFVPGQRPTADARHGTINYLCDDRYSDLGEGATYQSTKLDVRRAR